MRNCLNSILSVIDEITVLLSVIIYITNVIDDQEQKEKVIALVRKSITKTCSCLPEWVLDTILSDTSISLLLMLAHDKICASTQKTALRPVLQYSMYIATEIEALIKMVEGTGDGEEKAEKVVNIFSKVLRENAHIPNNIISLFTDSEIIKDIIDLSVTELNTIGSDNGGFDHTSK